MLSMKWETKKSADTAKMKNWKGTDKAKEQAKKVDNTKNKNVRIG